MQTRPPRRLSFDERRATDLAAHERLTVTYYRHTGTIRDVFALVPKGEPGLPKGYLHKRTLRRLTSAGILTQGKRIGGSEEVLLVLTPYGQACVDLTHGLRGPQATDNAAATGSAASPNGQQPQRSGP